MQQQPPGLVTRAAAFVLPGWRGSPRPQGCGDPATPAGGKGAGGCGGAAGAPLATRRQCRRSKVRRLLAAAAVYRCQQPARCCRSKVRQLPGAPLLAAAAATGGDRTQGGGRLLLHITLRYTAQRTAEPRLRITTGYVPELPQQRRDTTAAAAAGSTPPPRSGGGAGGGVALATVRRCHCTAAVAAHIERSQRCQLPPAGAAAATWGHEARQPAGAG